LNIMNKRLELRIALLHASWHVLSIKRATRQNIW
jgi:hypothetical protein